ncbi:MAG: pentapeptide repeat-containing protein [Cyanothece sp. SIO2G6]|nr:pentapeptide repeat-containing protein [Cyanothece sp. SIO2G6]
MFFSSLLFVLAASAVGAVVWATIISVLWLVIAAIAQRLSRYWPVVSGTFRGAFLLGCGFGILSSFGASDDFGIPVSASIAGSFLGALGGALWGYYGLTGWLKALRSGVCRRHGEAKRYTAREHFATITRPVSSRRPTDQLPSVVTAPQQPLMATDSVDEEIYKNTGEESNENTSEESKKDISQGTPPLTPLEKARQGEPDAIAHLLRRQLQSHGIHVQVQQRQGILKIGLRRDAPLQPKPTIRFLQQGLEKLQPQGIRDVQVVGQSGGETPQIWRRSLTLSSPATPDAEENPTVVDLPPQSTAYQPPRNPQKVVLEIGRSRYEIPAIIVWAFAGLLFLFDLRSGSFAWLGLRFFLAAIPAWVAQSRGRPGLPWGLYGYIFVPLALIFALILPQPQPHSLAQRNLKQASFRGRSLQRTDFRSADLRGADFSRTDLAGANFGNANCTGANFSGASISGANFNKTILDQANFTQVRQGKAVVSLAAVLGTIPPILWGLIIFLLTIAGIGMTFFWIFSWIPILPFVTSYSFATGLVAIALVGLTHRNRDAVPLILGVSVAVSSWAGLTNLAVSQGGFGFVAIALALAVIAYVFLGQNVWTGYGAAVGVLAGLACIEGWIAVANGFPLPTLLKLLICGIGAIAGYLAGAWTQATLPSFRAASLDGTDFTQGNLNNSDFRDTDTTRAIFKRTQRRGALFSDSTQPIANPLLQKIANHIASFSKFV